MRRSIAIVASSLAIGIIGISAAPASARPQQQPAVPLDVPGNAFSVSSYWSTYFESTAPYTYHVVFHGKWNFRDNYVNGSAPRDASAIAVSGFSPSCWTQDSDRVDTYDYTGKYTGGGTRYSASDSTSIREIHDRVSGFVLATDHGVHYLDLRQNPHGKSCGGRKAGSYYYEHNQDGNGSWSASVSVGVFSLSYSGSGGSALREAAKYNYFN